ncbi:MAG: hypothetical protein ACYDC1_16905 [Limisphaerales bacterium]
MHWMLTSASEHPDQEDKAAEREAHEQVVAVFLDETIEKPGHLQNVLARVFHTLFPTASIMQL